MKKQKLTPVQKKGISYQNKVQKLLRREYPKFRAYVEQWISLVDFSGSWSCRPDIFFVLPDRVLVIECKLTQTDEAFEQLDKTYKILLEHFFKRPAIGVQVCKVLTGFPKDSILSLEELITKPTSEIKDTDWTWHLTL